MPVFQKQPKLKPQVMETFFLKAYIIENCLSKILNDILYSTLRLVAFEKKNCIVHVLSWQLVVVYIKIF